MEEPINSVRPQKMSKKEVAYVICLMSIAGILGLCVAFGIGYCIVKMFL